MFWTIISKGDLITQLVATILIMGSIITWSLIIYKIIELRRIQRNSIDIPNIFWSAEDLKTGLVNINKKDSTKEISQLIQSSIITITKSGLKSQIPLSDRLEQSLTSEYQRIQRKIDMGMTLLATITSAAPFVGLFGTVWGIYGALINMSNGNAAGILDKISGPIGEALVMTAVGLAVAIPSLIAYNLFQKWSKNIKQEIEQFVYSLKSYVENNANEIVMVDVK